MNPTEYRISPNFMLSDFLGCHSVYADGIPNMLDSNDPELDLKLSNVRALAIHILEPILETFGPLSIGYSFLSPTTSRRLVKYQDPDKPSHHLWNLGAAADICVHRWVNADPNDDTHATSPIALARILVGRSQLPFSRLISYSESPYLCCAASQCEIEAATPRLAVYENRYRGTPGARPEFVKYASPGAKAHIASSPLTHGWRGCGYPRQHSLKIRQLHHRRVSKYTMLTDWLFDLSSMTNGVRNVPTTAHTELLYRAGDFYDRLIDGTGYNRFSVVAGFNEVWGQHSSFTLRIPQNADAQKVLAHSWTAARIDGKMNVSLNGDLVIAHLL